MAGERERLIRGRELLAGLVGAPALGALVGDVVAHDEEDALADEMNGIRQVVSAQSPEVVKAGMQTVLAPVAVADRAAVIAALRGQIDPMTAPPNVSPQGKKLMQNALSLAAQSPETASQLAALGERINAFEIRAIKGGSSVGAVAEDANTGAAGHSPVPGVLGGVLGLGSGVGLLMALKSRRAGAAAG